MKGLYQICSRQPVTWKQLGNEKRRRKNGKKFIISDTLYRLIAIYHLISLSMHPLSFLPSAVMSQPSTPHHMMGPWLLKLLLLTGEVYIWSLELFMFETTCQWFISLILFLVQLANQFSLSLTFFIQIYIMWLIHVPMYHKRGTYVSILMPMHSPLTIFQHITML